MGVDNRAFIGDNPSISGDHTASSRRKSGNRQNGNINSMEMVKPNGQNCRERSQLPLPPEATAVPVVAREEWGNDIEFLMSCIAMSVGLGNVWRFPFTALENGGGAFLIPYLIVLFIVGRPIYYMEMLIGQFSSRGSAKVFDMVPAMRGVGFGQVISIAIVSTYYVALMAITLKYFFDSFKSNLPWSECQLEWGPECNTYGDNLTHALQNVTLRSSAEMYFIKEVLKESSTIDDGIGIPDWKLVGCLALSWFLILMTLIKGVQSSGKASYFLALFPYVIMGILLARAVTLPGAAKGIIYFITPQWDKILSPKVWYAAVTQCFFSLSVCFGNIIMYSSFNKFSHNVYRDATIVTMLDTFTSMLAGCTIFGILGHLAHEVGIDDISAVVKGGTGLAFISYPDAIAKFEWMPQVFSVLFFFMLFVLGIGSNVAMTSCVMTVIRDEFPQVKHWQCACAIAFCGLCLGSVYVTPGGQFVLNLVDFYGASVIAFVLAIFELIAVGWIYGVDRLCKDTEFMIGRNPGLYWRLCWGIITPLLMVAILLYTIVTYEPLKYGDYVYPNAAYAAGWTLSCLGVMQLPIWAVVAIIKQDGNSWSEKFMGAFRPTADWGPRDPATFDRYQKHLSNLKTTQIFVNNGIFYRMKRNIFG